MCSCKNKAKKERIWNGVCDGFPWGGRELIDLILEPASPRFEYWANFVCRFNASRGRHTEEELSHSQLLRKIIFKTIRFFGSEICSQKSCIRLLIFDYFHWLVAYWFELVLAWSVLISVTVTTLVRGWEESADSQFSGRMPADKRPHCGRPPPVCPPCPALDEPMRVSSPSFATHCSDTMKV